MTWGSSSYCSTEDRKYKKLLNAATLQNGESWFGHLCSQHGYPGAWPIMLPCWFWLLQLVSSQVCHTISCHGSKIITSVSLRWWKVDKGELTDPSKRELAKDTQVPIQLCPSPFTQNWNVLVAIASDGCLHCFPSCKHVCLPHWKPVCSFLLWGPPGTCHLHKDCCYFSFILEELEVSVSTLKFTRCTAK